MKRSSHPKSPFFVQQGRRGGQKRARRLSAPQRSAIASQAAQARWHKHADQEALLTSVRLDHPRLDDLTFLEEILGEGSLADWRLLYQKISEQPYGPTAQSLEKVLAASSLYGVIPLWKGILLTLRGGSQ